MNEPERSSPADGRSPSSKAGRLWLALARHPWATAVFALALATRLAFLWLADQPLLYTHQYTYFTSALRILEHPDPLAYVVSSDDWRTWNRHWTIAPLYHLFAAATFAVFGPKLIAVRLIQCLLDSLAAVAVAALGRSVAPRYGAWAGTVYALYWPAIEMPTWTLTENLHTPLLVISVALLATEAARASSSLAFAGGLLLGLSALARSVSTGFLGLVSLWRLLTGRWRGWPPAAAVLIGGLLAILPWTARNVFLVGEPVLIETAAFENIWWANHFVDKERFRRQEEYVHSRASPAEKRSAALEFALRGIRRHPDLLLDKVRTNFWHFLRPEGLQNLLAVERSLEPWRHTGTLLLDDLPLLLALPLFVAFLFAGRASPARSLITLWTAYYLLMVVVVFHNEIRYRSAFAPFLFAGAAGGLSTLGTARRRTRIVAWTALAMGAWLSLASLRPYVAPARRALAAQRALRPALNAIVTGNLAAAEALAARAAELDPRSPRPWFDYGRQLAQTGHVPEAIAAYERGVPLASLANWRATVALACLRQGFGAPDDAGNALRKADRLSWNTDPWLLLEVAWRELPPPRSNEILLAQAGYGAVRGFLHPRGLDPSISRPRLEWNRYEELGGPQPPPGPHRWSRRRAWLRLLPTLEAESYDVTLHMSSPFPSTTAAPEVRVGVNGFPAARFTLTPEIRPYVVRAMAQRGQPIVVELRTPTWSRAGEPADQGVRVDRMTVAPAGQP